MLGNSKGNYTTRIKHTDDTEPLARKSNSHLIDFFLLCIIYYLFINMLFCVTSKFFARGRVYGHCTCLNT